MVAIAFKRPGEEAVPLFESLWKSRIDSGFYSVATYSYCHADIDSICKRLTAPSSDCPCWTWSGSRDSDGYGRVRLRSSEGRYLRAHRVLYELSYGSLSPSEILRHSCDRPCCVTACHLTPGTPLENARDRDSRGRNRSPRGSAHGCSVLSESDVVRIFARRREGKLLIEIGAEFGVSFGHIQNILSGKSWKHVQCDRTI